MEMGGFIIKYGNQGVGNKIEGGNLRFFVVFSFLMWQEETNGVFVFFEVLKALAYFWFNST